MSKPLQSAWAKGAPKFTSGEFTSQSKPITPIINNFVSQRYLRYYNYPVMPIQIVAGITVKF